MSVLKVRCRDVWGWEKEDQGMGLIKKLQEWSVIPFEMLCGGCQKPIKLSRVSSRVVSLRWRCQKKISTTGLKCTFSSSVASGTLFDGLRLPIEKVVCFMILWLKNESLKNIGEKLKISPNTVAKLLRFFRDIVFDKMVTKFEPIGDEKKTVEVDESKSF